MSTKKIKTMLAAMFPKPKINPHDIHIERVRDKDGNKTDNIELKHLPSGKSIITDKSDPDQISKLETKLATEEME